MKKLLLIMCLCSGVLASAQSKITWNMGMNIAIKDFGNMHPRITVDGAGNPLVIWGKMSDASVYFSKWNGSMFTTPVKLNPTWLTVASASWMGPDIASKGDTVYVVVKQTPESDTLSHIYIMSSFDGGVTFAAPVRVDFIADSVSRFPTVTVDGSGNPIVAFMKFNSKFLSSRWVVAKSTDYGKTFSTDVKASGYSGAKAEVCDCCPGAIISSGTTSSLLYRDNLSDIRDIWTGISTTNSTSFQSGFAIDNNKWKIYYCPSSGPDGIIIGDSIYSVFMSAGSGNERTYLSTSSISNSSLKSVANLTGNVTGLSQQNFPRIASDGNAMAIVWKQTVSGNSQLPILFTNDIAKGLPSMYELVDVNDITNADVAIHRGKVFVVWEDDNSGTIKFRSGTYPTSTTSVTEDTIRHFSIYPSPVSGLLTLQFDTEIPPNSLLKISNELGETVLSQILNDSMIATVNIEGLVNGVYFIHIQTVNNIYIQKFIKQ